MLELAILGLLKEQALHGYELKKQLTETLGASVSDGSLYPALAKLERAGAVVALDGADRAAAGQNAGRIPMTGSLGGELAAFRRLKSTEPRGRRSVTSPRRRKVYEITADGERLFTELLAAEPPSTEDDRTFHLKLAFARHLPAEARLGLFERRRAHLVERLARGRASLRAKWDRLDIYTRSLVEHSRETTERDISWLDQLIAAERQEGRK